MSLGSGSKLGRSDHVILQHCGGEAGPYTRYTHSSAERCRSGSQYVNTSTSVEVK